MQQNATLSAAVKKLLLNPAHSYPPHCCMDGLGKGQEEGGEGLMPACGAKARKSGLHAVAARILNLFVRSRGNNNYTSPEPHACPYKTGDDCILHYLWP